MKLLVIGSGGREHAMAWRLAQTPGMQKVYVAPGNAGTAREHELENINITDPEALADFVEQNKVHLTVVGPEAPLAAGVVNVFCGGGMTLGVGAGQMSRVDSTKIASIKAQNAGLELKGSVVASDAFFPFRDGLDVLAAAGAAAVIQPGGSMRDEEVIAAADEHGIAMVFTGVRHFRH